MTEPLNVTLQFYYKEPLGHVQRYKLEGRRGFDSRRCHWNFSLTYRPHSVPGVDSNSNRNAYQRYILGVKRPARGADNLTTFMRRLS